MEGTMRGMCTMTALAALMLGLAACGSTHGNQDDQVLTVQGFDDEGITQCDTFVGSNGEIDVQQDLCDMDTAEPFTDTFVNVNLLNNQKLDIQIDSYTINIEGASIGPYSFNATETAQGKRCSNDSTRSCATDANCTINTGLGTCLSSISSVPLRLIDINTKIRLIPDVVPLGRTFNVSVTLFGSDLSGADWQVTGDLTASFNDFNNCNCMLGQ